MGMAQIFNGVMRKPESILSRKRCWIPRLSCPTHKADNFFWYSKWGPRCVWFLTCGPQESCAKEPRMSYTPRSLPPCCSHCQNIPRQTFNCLFPSQPPKKLFSHKKIIVFRCTVHISIGTRSTRGFILLGDHKGRGLLGDQIWDCVETKPCNTYHSKQPWCW